MVIEPFLKAEENGNPKHGNAKPVGIPRLFGVK
jgi:hypothetical protein